MTYSLVIKKPCTRCTRVEEVPVSVEEAMEQMSRPEVQTYDARAEVAGHLPDVPSGNYWFGMLCAPCRSIVRRYFEQAFRKIDKKSAERGEEPVVPIEE